ncbi:MAG: ferredoxin [Chromatiaceae bacterium]|nr:ferredoxin [Chromatiaceae bacterium]
MTTAKQAGGVRRTQQRSGGAAPSLPVLPGAVKDVKTTRKLEFTLRHFHLGDPGAKAELEPAGDDFLPALLDPFRDTSRLRYEYPLFLYPPDRQDSHRKAIHLAGPLSEWLQQTVAAAAPGEDKARILKDHLPWLEHYLRQALAPTEGPVAAAARLAEAGEALQGHLNLDQAARERLAGDLQGLVTQAPAGAMLLAYGRYPALHLLVHAIHSRVIPRRARFHALIGNCIRGLKELLEVEWTKSDESIEPARARDSVGPGAALFDAAALSEVMDHVRGTHQMPSERRARIQQALAVLERWRDDPVLVRFVHDGSLASEWVKGDPSLVDLADVDPCERATRLFDEQAGRLAEAFSAVRIAQLEINGIYDPAIHDPWFAKFNWEGFSQDELLLVPSVIAVGSADWLAGDGLHAFSRLLSSGRPVQILIRVQPSNNPGTRPEENPFDRYRIELGYLGIAHRQAVVTQSSPARHEHLMEGFLSGLDATRTSLHLINTGLRPPSRKIPLNAWLVAGAALEGRAHPFFHVNPEAGDFAAARMNFAGNPQPELDWPIQPFHYMDENGNRVDQELAFTFADYALLIERLSHHFRIVPPGCESDALVPMQDYLAMKPDDAYQRMPYILAVDGNAQLHRLLVSRELALACLDRLNFWHTLQELAGVRNHYVDIAVERTRNEEHLLAEQERERVQVEHKAEVEWVRDTAAREAMERLSNVILGMDFTSGVPGGFVPPAPALRPGGEPAAAPMAVAPAQPQATVAQEETLSFDEPWIDTPLCTSCNDCMKVNPLLFLYNEDKQARLGDVNKATYAQLVKAAELCPAKCIHPGQPWNPNESGLVELIERAAPFNR